LSTKLGVSKVLKRFKLKFVMILKAAFGWLFYFV